MNFTLGATPLGGDRCQFAVWAPGAEVVEVQILNDQQCSAATAVALNSPEGRGESFGLQKTDRGYHHGIVEGIRPGAQYVYCLDGAKHRPDPASRYQPAGVHGPSEVVDLRAYRWNDTNWTGLSLKDYILYEIHVGTYSTEGTFDGIIPFLDEIKNLGVTAVELMPIAQFPGNRNWGYDGVYPFAVQNSYGGPEGLRRLVEACHERGLAVVLDVVYNHLGPEGNYLGDFAPYFTDKYRSPWGRAVNFDGPESDEVVRFFVENALYWVRDYHIDALRLDAIHGIVDCNAQPFLKLLAEAVHEFARQAGRKIYLIAESDLNDVRYIQPAECGGYGLDAQWSDDFHHALHTLLTGESNGYYLDFGTLKDLGKAVDEGYVYSGQFSAHRRRRHGNSSRHVPARQFVVFSQNHDQVGNRMLGERLSSLVSLEALKLAAGLVILSPYIPLLFMGEEWGEEAPFQYFTSHSDASLVEAVRRGRREEFAAFGWQGEVPDPQDAATFLRCKLDHTRKSNELHRILWAFYQELIRLRRSIPAFARLSKEHLEVRVFENERVLQVRRWTEGDQGLMVANFGHDAQGVLAPACARGWRKRMDSSDARWHGHNGAVPARLVPNEEVTISLSPTSFVAFQEGE